VLRELWPVAALTAAAGLALGSLDVLAVAFTEARHEPGAVSWVLACLSLGSAVGGIANGALAGRGSSWARLCRYGLGLGAALAAAGLTRGVPLFAAAVTLAGLFVAPALTTAYLAADETAPAGARAGARVNAALNAGTSLGTAGVGLLLGRLPLSVCFLLAAVPLLAAAGAGQALVGAGTAARARG
jgi:MFS family permease